MPKKHARKSCSTFAQDMAECRVVQVLLWEAAVFYLFSLIMSQRHAADHTLSAGAKSTAECERIHHPSLAHQPLPRQYREALQNVHSSTKRISKTLGYLVVHLIFLSEYFTMDQHDCYQATGLDKALNALILLILERYNLSLKCLQPIPNSEKIPAH